MEDIAKTPAVAFGFAFGVDSEANHFQHLEFDALKLIDHRKSRLMQSQRRRSFVVV